jgi:hypothetical protein
MARAGKTKKSRIIGSHTTTDRRFLVTNAYQHRIKHTHIPPPLPKPVSGSADYHDQIFPDNAPDVASDQLAGLNIKQKAKRYANSVRFLSANQNIIPNL